ncbi:MAG TPA: hypothetical protein PKH07_05120, partial [bacterium]|nr:hypothetical protein [bacterium]
MKMLLAKPEGQFNTTVQVTGLLVIALFALGILLPGALEASIAPQVRLDAQWLSAQQSRYVGSEGHDNALQQLLNHLERIQGITLWTHDYPLLIPHVWDAHL